MLGERQVGQPSRSLAGMPSQSRTARSTTTNYAGLSTPRARINFACGIVIRFWVLKTPARRNDIATRTSPSNGEMVPRRGAAQDANTRGVHCKLPT